MTKELYSLNSKKEGTFENISAKVLKTYPLIFVIKLFKNMEFRNFRETVLPSNLKLADITPAYKKKDPVLAENYRPVSVLPTASKVFGRMIQKQLSTHIERFFFTLFVWI